MRDYEITAHKNHRKVVITSGSFQVGDVSVRKHGENTVMDGASVVVVKNVYCLRSSSQLLCTCIMQQAFY